MKADKPKVVDEVFDDQRIRSFLFRDGAGPKDAGGFLILQRAYQGMRPGDFERFVQEFVREGGNVDARDSRGQTLADHLATHRYGKDFLETLLAAGAAAPSEGARKPADATQ